MKLILLIIFLFLILPTVKSKTNYFTYEEKQTENPNSPKVFMTDFFDDNTIIAQIVRKDYLIPENNGVTCLEKFLSIRTIHFNGSIEAFDIPADVLGIQSFNFCLIFALGLLRNPIQVYAIKNNFLLVTYTTATNISDVSTYDDYAMVLDLNGNVRSKILLGHSYVDLINNKWIPYQDAIVKNVDRNKGFLRLVPKTNTNEVILQQFIVTDDGIVNYLTAEVIIPSPNSNTVSIVDYVAMMDGGYAILYTNYMNSQTIPQQDPLSFNGGLYALFLGYNKESVVGPVILYQNSAPGLMFPLLNCQFTYVDVGQTCILSVNDTLNQSNFYIRVDFLSSGTVYNIKTIPSMGYDQLNIQTLLYGGYLLSGLVTDVNNNNNVYGYIFDEFGRPYPWDLQNPTKGNFKSDFKILPNNTFVLPLPEVGNNWYLVATDLPKVEVTLDHGYNNLHINTTFPMINDTISASDIKFLTIKYYNQVDLTYDTKITIIQDDGSDHGIIRQIISYNENTNDENTKFLTLDDDGITINIAVIDSTFNVPGGRYYVLIDDGFVKDRKFGEPIFGIRKNVWSFTINDNPKSENLDDNLNSDDNSIFKKLKELVNSSFEYLKG
ncbi:hypothetical protein C1645_830057 [Glomus cerebriforme]|uniref:Uncharacterized protein n=1 Tax=Glomus cerebriforme TaxID=658196 RepID=A0A397STD9_9GLOM|nr:hypothetical protein C1645_830057 [Glomus cerebriforme]